MADKFTEEQYQRIVEIWNDEVTYKDGAQSVTNFIVKIGSYQYEKALAIANPITREWAHDKFVEKEKKYRWSSKKLDENSEHVLLYKDRSGAIYGILMDDNGSLDEDEQLTESEIKEWGYNPDMFDREGIKND